MRNFVFLMLRTLALALPLSSCEGPMVPQREPFVEADFAGSSGTGSGAVVGQAFVVMESGTVRFPKHGEMYLMPVNAYTTEIISRKYVGGENLAPGDPRYARYARSATTDGWGRFEFRHLPAGEYYVGTTVHWTSTSNNAEDGTDSIIDHYGPIYARVSLHGQTARVENWQLGRQKDR